MGGGAGVCGVWISGGAVPGPEAAEVDQLNPAVIGGTGGKVTGSLLLPESPPACPPMAESHFSTTVPLGFAGSAKACMPLA